MIQIYFDSIIEEWRNNCKCEISGFELRGKAYKRRVKTKPAGSIVVDYCCIDKKGKICQYPASPYKSGEKYSGQYLPLKVTREIKANISFIYVDVMRDYSKQDPGNRWSILRKMLNDINLSLSSDKELVDVQTLDGQEKMTRKQAFEYKIKEAYGYLQTEEFKSVEEKIKNNSLEQMGINPQEGDVSIGFNTYDSMNVFKNLQLYVEQMGIRTTADMVGAGLQSAIVIAIFRTYEEIKKEGTIFAIEEPEVYLHPQKQRYFSNILVALGKQNQVFITTHSPTFVRLYEPEHICLIRRSNSGGTTATTCDKEQLIKTEKDALKIENYFDNQRNEMFFAKAVMLVEGATEKFVFPTIVRMLGHDFDQYGISVIECGGKGNLSVFAKVAQAFNIPYVVIADDDIKDISDISDNEKKKKVEQENESHQKKNKILSKSIPNDNLFWMIPNIEAVLGINENSDNKIRQALERIKSEGFKEVIPTEIMSPIKKIAELINIDW